ncbi:hypothetical protein K1719_019638 [Acacia pycnantha]|nr:hypothetical protein K1719_019638 [Acacia pycnantha]
MTGKIASSFSNFPELQLLNLSNNSLTGEIPESLAVPPNLSDIILTGNEIKGPIPPRLVQKMNAGNLNLSADKLEKPKNPGMSKATNVGTIVGGTARASSVISGLAYTLKVRFGLRFDMCIRRESKEKMRAEQGRRIYDEERRSGKKKEDCESRDKTTVCAGVKATKNTGESGSESLIGKVSDAIQEQISGL